MATKDEFAELVERYKTCPEFYSVRFADANQTGLTGDTLLHAAVIRGIPQDVDILMRAGARVNAVGDMGDTPLHHAASRGLTEIVQQLLRYGANRDIKNEFGETPIDVAALMKHHKVEAILRGPKTPTS